MAKFFRVAVFNVENLFGRAKALNLYDKDEGDEILKKVDEFRELLKKTTYNTGDKARILELYNKELKTYISVREDRGKLFKKRGWAITGVKADGVKDWDGSIEFKRDKFSNLSRKNTARVIKDVKADVACIVEVENRETLRSFDAHLLKSRYKYEMLIDANDPRNIDVGLYSKYPLGGIWTHMFDKSNGKTIFSRNCLEIEIFLPNGQTLFMLGNHFKSRGYDFDGTASAKRERQAKKVVKILDKYDLTKDWVVVAGDFNDNPDSAPLKPLLTVPNLFDVLQTQFPDDPMKRWTYHYDNFEQIDFILVSKPLQDRFRKAGVERRGIEHLEKLTAASDGLVEMEKEYDSVTHWTNAASDHGAVWAEFTL